VVERAGAIGLRQSGGLSRPVTAESERGAAAQESSNETTATS
jgi:hypothetical protein